MIAAVSLSLAVLTAGSPLSVSAGSARFTGLIGRKQDAFIENRILGSEARGRIYRETVDAFRTHYDDRHAANGGKSDGKGYWQGEYWGKTLLSVAATVEVRKDRALADWMRREARAFVKEFQQPDGYLCTYADRLFVGGPKKDADRLVGKNKEVFSWNLWGRKYTMWALLEIARVADAPDLVTAAAKMMDQEIEQLNAQGVDISETGYFVGLPSMSVLKPLLLLYRATGEGRYRAFARHIVSRWDRAGGAMPNLIANAYGEKDVHEWYPDPAWWAKAYEMMSCVEGLIDWGVAENDGRVLEAAKRLVDKIGKAEANVLGSVGFFDHFTHAAACANATTEPCDVTHWIRVNRDLFAVTDDSAYLDTLEFAYLNAFLAAVYRDGKWGAHSVRSHGTCHRAAPHQVGMKYHQCCIDNMPRTFADVAQVAVTRSPDGALSVNLYSDFTLDCDGGRIEVFGGYPYSDHVTVKVASEKSGRIRFRIPACFDEVRVGGVKATGRWFAADYPSGGKSYALDFVRTLKLVRSAAKPDADPRSAIFERANECAAMKGLSRKTPGIALAYGPILLAKGLYAGTAKNEILKDRLCEGADCRLSLEPANPVRTDAAWTLRIAQGGRTVSLPVSDFASVADVDDPENLFSIWF